MLFISSGLVFAAMFFLSREGNHPCYLNLRTKRLCKCCRLCLPSWFVFLFLQRPFQVISCVLACIQDDYHAALEAADFAENEVGYRVRLWLLYIMFRCPSAEASSIRQFRALLPPLTVGEIRNVSHSFVLSFALTLIKFLPSLSTGISYPIERGILGSSYAFRGHSPLFCRG